MKFNMDSLFNNLAANQQSKARRPNRPRPPARRQASNELANVIIRAAKQSTQRPSGLIIPRKPGGLMSAQYPVHGARLSSNFGPRVHPVSGGYSNHTGIDFAIGGGSPVYAPVGGIVDRSAWDNVYGNQIIMEHGRHQQTMYGHLDKSIVKPGQRVNQGDVIGYVGSTGLSTGPHLHWETWINGRPVNPMKFL